MLIWMMVSLWPTAWQFFDIWYPEVIRWHPFLKNYYLLHICIFSSSLNEFHRFLLTLSCNIVILVIAYFTLPEAVIKKRIGKLPRLQVRFPANVLALCIFFKKNKLLSFDLYCMQPKTTAKKQPSAVHRKKMSWFNKQGYLTLIMEDIFKHQSSLIGNIAEWYCVQAKGERDP